jgi:hypothetical protein
MLDLNFDYASCIRNSEKVSWKLDEVFPLDTKLDFSRPFLPAALAGKGALSFLDEGDKKKLNQITGNAYLNLFQFVEEYILAMSVQHAQAEMFGDHDAIRALCRFAEEEAKHQALFWRYRAAFDRDVGKPCGVLGEAAAVAGVILGKSPIAVTIVTCHLELMTQQHYTECVRDDGRSSPSSSVCTGWRRRSTRRSTRSSSTSSRRRPRPRSSTRRSRTTSASWARSRGCSPPRRTST